MSAVHPPLTTQHKTTFALGGINPWQVVRIALKAILTNPLRSALTALGVIIGVASVVALTALGTGSTANITKSLEGLGTNLLTVQNARGGGPSLVQGGSGSNLTLKEAEAIQALGSEVAAVAPTLQGNYQIKAGSSNTNTSVIGTWPEYTSVRNSKVEVGEFFTSTDNQARKRTAVIGYQIAQDFYGSSQAALGQKIRIAGVSFTVVGVLPDKGNTGFGNPNSQVLVPLLTYLQRLGRSSSTGQITVQAIYVQATSQEVLSDLQTRITDLLATRHNISDSNSYDFRVQNQADSLASVNQITQTMTLFLGGIAGISLLVGGIGIMNIMLVSVIERTKEIGTRKALGAKPRDILTQFLVEAFVLSVGGGLIGILAGVGLALGLGKALGVTSMVSSTSILLAFSFSAVVGIFFGMYPAQRAARLDPVESLRYE